MTCALLPLVTRPLQGSSVCARTVCQVKAKSHHVAYLCLYAAAPAPSAKVMVRSPRRCRKAVNVSASAGVFAAGASMFLLAYVLPVTALAICLFIPEQRSLRSNSFRFQLPFSSHLHQGHFTVVPLPSTGSRPLHCGPATFYRFKATSLWSCYLLQAQGQSWLKTLKIKIVRTSF